MSAALHSSHWYRVAALQPRLRPQVRVQRLRHRNQVWHQLVDAASGRRHRLNQEAWRFVGCLDGQVTVDAAWEAAVQRDGDLALSQDEAIRVLQQLSSAELLQCDLPPDIGAQFRAKHKREARQRWHALNPLSIRVPLLDPARLLDRCVPFLPWLFSRSMFILWLAAILPALLMTPRYLPELIAFASAHAETPRYLAIAWIIYPLIKALHEAGHALAVRRWGGEVHQAGFTMFLFMPVPFVDASAAAGFPERSRRAVVSAIGIMIELLLAALGFYVWIEVQPGLVRDIAFVTLLTAGLSTLVVNGNPLLRFDGYFLLCDIADLPNLDQRSRAWWTALLQRWLFGSVEPAMPVAAGERKWLALYAPLAWSYRLVLGIKTLAWGAGKSALLGLLLAAAYAAVMLTGPLRTAGALLLRLLRDEARPHARLAVALTTAGLLLIVALLPLPFGVAVSAVVWLPEQAQVRAGTDGTIQTVLVRDGMTVIPGQILAVLHDPDLHSAHTEAASRLDALLAEQYHLMRSSRAQAVGLAQAIAHAETQVAWLDTRIAALTLRSAVAGRVVLLRQDDLAGTYLKKGALFGHVLSPGSTVVRAVVPHSDAALVRERGRAVSVWLEDHPGSSFPARLLRDTPAAAQNLPSDALSEHNGGAIATDPNDSEHRRLLEPFFLFDIEVPVMALERAGGRARAYFDFGPAPLAVQWTHGLRQLTLRHFGTAS